MNVALVYDRVNRIGGAERILEVLHQLYPQAPLFTAVYNPRETPWADGWDIRPSFLNRVPFAKSNHEFFPWLTPLAFESFAFENFDLVVSVSSAEAKGILTKPNTFHLCYCLTPTRYLWQDCELYQESIPLPLRPLTVKVFTHLRSWDAVAANRPDGYLAISQTVAHRMKAYYNRDADVIYPPVDVERFAVRKKTKESRPLSAFFLIVSRLVAYKRVDLAIAACNALRLPLTVVGTGLEEKRLKKMAGPTITFAGKLTEEDLVLYYQRCQALISPQEEDFGIALVEAQAAGKPVIAFGQGGATEIVRTGETGIFFPRQTAASLIRAVRKFKHMRFSPIVCQENAKRFNKERFRQEFSKRVEELWEKYSAKNVP